MINQAIIKYALLALTAYSGVIFGFLISNWLKKETQQYRRYFFIISTAVLALSVPAIILCCDIILVFIAGSAFLATLAALFMFRPQTAYTYPVLGILLYLSSRYQDLLFFEAMIIFIYGLVSAPYEHSNENIQNLKRVFYNLSFLITAIIPVVLAAFF